MPMDPTGASAITQFLKSTMPSKASDSHQIRPDFIIGSLKRPVSSSNMDTSQQAIPKISSPPVNSRENIFATLFSTAKVQENPVAESVSRPISTKQTQRTIIALPKDDNKRIEATPIQLPQENFSIQAFMETILLPSVSSACTLYMNQLADLFKAKLEQVQLTQFTIPEDASPLIELLTALQNQDADQVFTTMRQMDHVGKLFSCLSLARLVDLVSLLSQFLSRRIFLITLSASTASNTSIKDDIAQTLPWILDALVTLYHQKNKASIAETSLPIVLETIREQVDQIEQSFIQDEQSSTLLGSINEITGHLLMPREN
jgi:hypothetical protein